MMYLGCRSAAARFRSQRPSWKIAIVETQTRLGGRAYTKRPDGFDHSIDVGAQWIHGTIGNPLVDDSASGSDAPVLPSSPRKSFLKHFCKLLLNI